MVRDFGLKLKVTILALGFATQKELHRHFREIAPASAIEQDNLYKWIQGRSTPRSSKVYEYWAGMLRLDRPLAHLKGCSIEEFVDDMTAAYGLDRALVASITAGGVSRGAAAQDPAHEPSGVRRELLCGAFACYSYAFSPIFKRKILRGGLFISAPDPSARLKVLYAEVTPFTELVHRGRLSWSNRLVMFDLHDERNDSRVHLTLHCPSAPASVLTGLMSGSSFHDSSPQPTASRFVAIRVPSLHLSELGGRDCVFDLADHPISSELTQLGLLIADPGPFDLLIAAFFAGDNRTGFDQVAVDASARLNFALDRELAHAAAKSVGTDAPPIESRIVLPFQKKPRR